jgi:hypothetical protein
MPSRHNLTPSARTEAPRRRGVAVEIDRGHSGSSEGAWQDEFSIRPHFAEPTDDAFQGHR